ncbi:MAG: cell wall-active antibiotics response protein LiaF [bacterium]
MGHRKIVFGLVLVLIGVLLLGRSLDLFYFGIGDLMRILLPLAFIVAGIWMIVRKKQQEDRLRVQMESGSSATTAATDRQRQQSTETVRPGGFQETAGKSSGVGDQQPASPQTDSHSRGIKYSKALGDLFVDCRGVSLENIEISSGIGDIDIRLHGGQLASGLNRIIISGFIGDIRIFIPGDIPYHIHCSNFIGDINACGQQAGGLSNTVENQSSDYDSSQSKLYIAANNFIGDVKLFED